MDLLYRKEIGAVYTGSRERDAQDQEGIIPLHCTSRIGKCLVRYLKSSLKGRLGEAFFFSFFFSP